ncbi:MAG: hypothetical protein M1405_02605 [Patescibacteria group bacterium]|nr:hypothetical protein [Patescibacteria group bacterium]
MTEALRTAPAENIDGITPAKPPRPNHADIPHELISPAPEISEKRGRFIENRVKKIIASQVDLVEDVILNEPNGNEDTMGHDLTVILKDDSPIRTVYVQVKSRREAVTAYKQKVRDKYFSNNGNSPELVKRWLTEHGIILLNGSETKTDQDIIDSFRPQLERIQQRESGEQNTEDTGQMKFFPGAGQIQIFP